jgi:hypothetical protein
MLCRNTGKRISKAPRMVLSIRVHSGRMTCCSMGGAGATSGWRGRPGRPPSWVTARGRLDWARSVTRGTCRPPMPGKYCLYRKFVSENSVGIFYLHIYVRFYALINKKIKFSSYTRKFRVEQLQSHIYLRKGFLIYEEMRKYFPIFEEAAVSHIWLCYCSIRNFLIYEENLIFFFISAMTPKLLKYCTAMVPLLIRFSSEKQWDLLPSCEFCTKKTVCRHACCAGNTKLV